MRLVKPIVLALKMTKTQRNQIKKIAEERGGCMSDVVLEAVEAAFGVDLSTNEPPRHRYFSGHNAVEECAQPIGETSQYRYVVKVWASKKDAFNNEPPIRVVDIGDSMTPARATVKASGGYCLLVRFDKSDINGLEPQTRIIKSRGVFWINKRGEVCG